MFKNYRTVLLSSLMVLFLSSSPAFAEWYVGGGVGLSMPHNVTDFTHTDFTRLDGSDDLSSDSFQSTLTDFSADSSFTGEIKGGYFFEKVPYFGIEVNLSFSQSESNQESVVVKVESINDKKVFSTNSADALLSMKSELISYGFLGVFRTPNEYAKKYFNGFQPFVGVGVALNSMDLKEGLVEFPGDEAYPISLSSSSDTAIGLLLSVGVNYIVNDHVKLYSEYKYKKASFELHQGEEDTITFDASDSSVLVGVSYSF